MQNAEKLRDRGSQTSGREHGAIGRGLEAGCQGTGPGYAGDVGDYRRAVSNDYIHTAAPGSDVVYALKTCATLVNRIFNSMYKWV